MSLKKVVTPTRVERLYGEIPQQAEELRARLPDELQAPECPVCKGSLTPLRAKKREREDIYGETVTYQCHTKKYDKMCLAVVTVTQSVGYYMRPGDFGLADIDWRTVAPDTIPAVEAEKIVPKTPEFDGVKIKPEYPGNRETLNKVAWDRFWDLYFNQEGYVRVDHVRDWVVTMKGDNAKVRELFAEFPKFIQSRSGYAVKDDGILYTVTGRGHGAKGDLGLPWSDPEYQKQHGFTV